MANAGGFAEVLRAMKKLASLFVLLALPCLAWGQLVMFRADLSGLNETPPNSSTATGLATATFDPTDLGFVLDLTFSGLTSPETAAHIHTGPVGVAAPVTIPFALGSPFHLETTLTSAQASNLLSGLFYVNVHSTMFRAGEIRGQLLAVPEPSTYALAGVALLGLVICQRRRSNARRCGQN